LNLDFIESYSPFGSQSRYFGKSTNYRISL
jgi:hypothetical protein